MSDNKQYVVVATIQDKQTGKLWGYRLFNLDRLSVVDVKKDAILKGINTIHGVQYDSTYDGLVSTTTVGLSQLPVVEYPSKRIKGLGGILVTELITDGTGDIIGVVAYDTNGARGQLDLESIFRLRKNSIAINYEKSVSIGSKIDIIDLGFEVPTRPLDSYKRSSYRVTDTKTYIDKTGKSDNEYLTKVPVYDLSSATSSTFNISANEKIMRATNNIKLLSPYYYVLLSTVQKQPCEDDFCKTMCVTENKMYYNIGFISSLTVGELAFVLMHEVLHIAMMHVARCNKRDPKLWNVATDLYINELLIHDFDLVVGVEKQIQVRSPKTNDIIEVPLCCESSCLYFGRIGKVCNLSKDLPEAIYARLEKKGGQQGAGGSNGGKSQGGENGGSPQSNSGNNGDQEDENLESQGSGQGNKGDGNSEQGGTEKIYLDGEELGGSCIDEMKSEVGQDSEEKAEASKDLAKQKAQDMVTKKRMVEDKTGTELTAGLTGADIARRIIEFELNSKLDWRKVLKNIVAEKPRKKYTLASPNEAYMNMGITLASRRRIGKPTKLKNIVIAIDVSGSVTDAMIKEFLGEVAGIFQHYDAEGILLYWNTEVASFGKFGSIKDMLKIDNQFTGGTDVKCVFDFLTGKETVNGQKFPVPARDVKAVIILTDGCFSKNYEDYAREFARKTLWLIEGNAPLFDSAFGEVLTY